MHDNKFKIAGQRTRSNPTENAVKIVKIVIVKTMSKSSKSSPPTKMPWPPPKSGYCKVNGLMGNAIGLN